VLSFRHSKFRPTTLPETSVIALSTVRLHRVVVDLNRGSVANDDKVAAELAPLMRLTLPLRPACGSSFH
jgi:hypothetical protein